MLKVEWPKSYTTRIVWVVGIAIYKIAENWALNWITSAIEPSAGAALKTSIWLLPILTWIVAAAGLVWLTLRTVAPSEAKASATTSVSAVAYLRSISMIYQADAIQVHCTIAAHAFRRTQESPTELVLKLRAQSDSGVICRVQLPRAPAIIEAGEWATMPYSGVITHAERSNLLRAIRQTMRELPESGPVFAEIEIALPDGPARAMHSESGVQLGLPAWVGGPESAVVMIANWSQGVPEKWRLDAEEIAKQKDRQRSALDQFIREFNELVERIQSVSGERQFRSIAVGAFQYTELPRLSSDLDAKVQKVREFLEHERPAEVGMFLSCGTQQSLLEKAQCYREKLMKIHERI